MKKQIIKGAKPANTSKTSTSNSTSPKTSAKESSTSTTSKHPTADTTPTTGADTPKQSAVGSKVVVEADYCFDRTLHAFWFNVSGDVPEGTKAVVECIAKAGHTCVLANSASTKPRLTLVATLWKSAAGLSAKDLIEDAHLLGIKDLDDEIKREVVALKQKATPVINRQIQTWHDKDLNEREKDSIEVIRGVLAAMHELGDDNF